MARHDPLSLPDATARHLATDLDWRDPPRIVQRALAAADPAFPVDGLAAWRDLDAATRPDPQRQARLDAAAAHLSSLGPASWPGLQSIQSILLGVPARFRTADAFARHPVQTRRYGWRSDLEEALSRRLDTFAVDQVHPLVRAVRLYLEIIFVHPFDDGNGRAARLWFAHTCRLDGFAVPDLAVLASFPKEPGRPLRCWGMVAHAARLITPVRPVEFAEPCATVSAMSSTPRLPWSLLSASLSEYDRDGLHAALTAVLDAGLPARGKLPREWKVRRPLLESVRADITARTGAWHPGGRIPIYSEKLGGACSCHSFCPLGVTPEHARPEAVAAGVDSVLVEVDRIRDYLMALGGFYAQLALPEDAAERLVALEEAAEALIDLIILHTEAHDSWYSLIVDAGVWMAEVVGAAPPEVRLKRTVYASCTSWKPPEPAQRRAMHGDIAEILG